MNRRTWTRIHVNNRKWEVEIKLNQLSQITHKTKKKKDGEHDKWISSRNQTNCARKCHVPILSALIIFYNGAPHPPTHPAPFPSNLAETNRSSVWNKSPIVAMSPSSGMSVIQLSYIVTWHNQRHNSSRTRPNSNAIHEYYQHRQSVIPLPRNSIPLDRHCKI